jgi:hypothetical protein
MTIPKRIIQTGKTPDLPPLCRAAVANVRLLNPDFEYCFFDDDQVAAFIAKEFPEYRAVFDSFPYPIQRYDFFRYLAVYRLGGFYFDLDVLLSRGLSPLLEFGCVFSFEELTMSRFLRERCEMDWEIGNYAFGAAAGHPFLKELIANCVKGQENPEFIEPMVQLIPRCFRRYYYVFNTTGPAMLTRTLAEHPELLDQIEILLPNDVFDKRNWSNFGDYGVHLAQGSWLEKRGKWQRRLVGWWEVWTRRALEKESRRRGAVRSKSGMRREPVGSRFAGVAEKQMNPGEHRL